MANQITEHLHHIRPGSRSSPKQKLAALQALANLPDKEKWVEVVSTQDINFISYLIDLADLSSSLTFTQDTLNLWQQTMRAMSDVATQLRKASMDEKVSLACWNMTRKRFPRIIDQIWKRKKSLTLLEPKSDEIRVCIIRVIRLLADGVETYKDKILKMGLYKYHALELNMIFWSLDTGAETKNATHDYFRIYFITQRVDEDEYPAMARFSENMSKPDIISFCKTMLDKERYSHLQSQDAMQAVLELTIATKAFSLWNEQDFRKALITIVWRQLKKPSDQNLQAFLAMSIEYFDRMMEAVWPNPNEIPAQRFFVEIVEPLIADSIVPMFARIIYEMAGTKPNSTNYQDDRESIAGQTRVYSRMLNSVVGACNLKRSLIAQHILPIWLHDLDAFRDLDSVICPRKVDAIKIWTMFGRDLGLDEATLRREDTDSQLKVNNGLVGCSWHRCVLYKDQPQAKLVMMRDTNDCGLVQYCSVRCQKRDWNDGGHKAVCKPAKALFPNGR